MSSKQMDYRFRKAITMHRKGLTSLWLLPLMAALLWAPACNQPGKEIVRVQTNLVDKSIFEGEWWASQTVLEIDEDAAQIGAFAGQMSWADLGIDKGQSGSVARIRAGTRVPL